MRRERGFTIIELMVTIIVLAILLSMAIPSFQSMIERRRLIAVAESVYSDLQFARSEAVKRSENMRVTIDPANGSDWCLEVVEDESEASIVRTCGDPELNIEMVNDLFSVTFGGVRGVPLDNVIPPAIEFASPSSLQLRVLIAPYIGRIRMCSPLIQGVGKLSGYPSC